MKKSVLGMVLSFGFVGLANAQIKIACIGNSITEGYGLANAATESYPSRLQALFGNGYTVQNDGASGRTMLKSDDKNSYWKFGKLKQALDLKPALVAIELGTNDANNFAGQWNSVSAEFKTDYISMVDTLSKLSSKPKIFLVMPLPIRGNNDATLVKANAIIKEVGAATGATVVDCYTPFKDRVDLYRTGDGLHPNAAGADTMAHIIYRAMTKPVVAVRDLRPAASGSALVADFEGNNFAFVAQALANGGEFRIRVYDFRGALVASAEVRDGSPAVEAIHARLRSSPGINWLSLEKMK